MPVKGRKPKPPGQARNRNRPTHDWTLVPDRPFVGSRPKLPQYRLNGRQWPSRTKDWWAAVRSMPHCVLWGPSDWQFAIDTAMVAAEFHDGGRDALKASAELRQREKILGTTADFRRDLRVRYVDPDEVESDERGGEAAEVTQLDDYRDLYGPS